MARYIKSKTVDEQGRSSTAWVEDANAGSGATTMEAPSGPVNGSNAAYAFSSPPIIVFRNGVNETRLGTINGNIFTFDTPPQVGDDIEGLI